LVELKSHRLLWLRQRVELLGAATIFTYIGILVVVALYYLLLETHWKLPFMARDITGEWHHLVANNVERHDFRDVGEGFLGGLMAHMIVWNHYRKIRPKNILDRLEIFLRIPNVKDERPLSKWQVLLLIPIALVYAVPGYLAAKWAIQHFHLEEAAAQQLTHGHGVLNNIKEGFTENWPKRVMGFAAAFLFGRRPAKAVYDDIQLWFAERRVALDKPLHWFYTPPFKARYNAIREQGVSGFFAKDNRWRSVLFIGGLVLCVALAGFGYYVKNYIAK
jgi:hypothetical protein